MHKRLPSFSLTASSTDNENEEETRSSSKETPRSRSPFRRATGYSNKRDPSAEGLRIEGYESEVEIDMTTGVRPSNNFDSSESEEEESETDEEDEQLERNTEVSKCVVVFVLLLSLLCIG